MPRAVVAKAPAYLFAAAFLLDAVMGDPEGMPHPVRAMGWVIQRMESALYGEEQTSSEKLVAGAILTLTVIGGTILNAKSVLDRLRKLSRPVAVACELLLAASCLALRNLLEEAGSVIRALEMGDIATARLRLARIVGRDTQHLDASEISRAVIETLAESFSDGVIAPMLFLAIGGVPLALGYKAVNTLDSMIGHRNERYLYFGRVAARLDDLANFLPARCSALLFSLTAGLFPGASSLAAVTTWLEDGSKHASPNAGQPEAAMAGALGVCLGGANTYDGEVVDSPRMGAAFRKPEIADARRALHLVAAAGMLAAGFCWWLLRKGEKA
jgi:adenosylcobinamide-phosphate synthase